MIFPSCQKALFVSFSFPFLHDAFNGSGTGYDLVYLVDFPLVPAKMELQAVHTRSEISDCS
jgi:hypothetical protein